MMSLSKFSVALACGALAAVAAADTIATFADPALNGSTPLFSYNSGTGTLSGGWSGTGLTLQIPSPLVGGPQNYADAKFTMTNLTVGAGGVTNAGKIDFLTSGNALIMSITFDKATLIDPFGLGASYLKADNVQFLNSGGVPYNLDQEQFAFSFANPVQSGNISTWTSAFTSSAVPEPSALVLLLAGSIAGLIRRR